MSRRILTWETGRFDGTVAVDARYRSETYRIDDPPAVAELCACLRETAFEPGVGVGSCPATWLTFQGRDGSTLEGGLERQSVLSVVGGVIHFDPSFLAALQRHVARLAGRPVDLLYFGPPWSARERGGEAEVAPEAGE